VRSWAEESRVGPEAASLLYRDERRAWSTALRLHASEEDTMTPVLGLTTNGTPKICRCGVELVGMLLQKRALDPRFGGPRLARNSVVRVRQGCRYVSTFERRLALTQFRCRNESRKLNCHRSHREESHKNSAGQC
jgi:hypothetical protein